VGWRSVYLIIPFVEVIFCFEPRAAAVVAVMVVALVVVARQHQLKTRLQKKRKPGSIDT
jgi:hypothetical protein